MKSNLEIWSQQLAFARNITMIFIHFLAKRFAKFAIIAVAIAQPVVPHLAQTVILLQSIIEQLPSQLCSAFVIMDGMMMGVTYSAQNAI